MTTRRTLVAALSAIPVAMAGEYAVAQSATPDASPIPATPVSEDVVGSWLEAQADLSRLGEAASTAFWNADADALAELATPLFAGAMKPETLTAIVDGYTTNQQQFAFEQVGGWFFGQYTPESIQGVFHQGSAIAWQIEPDEPQVENFPTGTWTGTIGPGQIDLGIGVTFEGDADSMAVLLSIPAQMVMSAQMSSVTYAQDLPVGERTDVRSIPVGGHVTPVNLYGEQYRWGEHSLVLSTVWDTESRLASLLFNPEPALPTEQEIEPVRARLPFDGQWVVVWGGNTTFRNYHAATPAQRHALDIVMWRDGSSASGDGTTNEDYWCFGQPYLAPVDGVIAATLDEYEDIPPQTAGNPNHHPAGNHVVIESQGAFFYMAHCQSGSIMVQVGDEVKMGDVVAAVGNSGNTSEPHVHLHAQNSKDLFDPAAIGIPIVFDNAVINDEPTPDAQPNHGQIVEFRP